MMVSGKYYEMYKNGDSFSDSELLEAWAYFAELEKMLSPLGPVFHLSWLEAKRVSDGLRGFAESRGFA